MQVLINGKVAGFFERSNPRNLPLPNVFGISPNEQVRWHPHDRDYYVYVWQQLQLMARLMRRLAPRNGLQPASNCYGRSRKEARCNKKSITVKRACLQVTLDILVEALGRVNFGCVWDFKGLTSPKIKLNGEHHRTECLCSFIGCRRALVCYYPFA